MNFENQSGEGSEIGESPQVEKKVLKDIKLKWYGKKTPFCKHKCGCGLNALKGFIFNF